MQKTPGLLALEGESGSDQGIYKEDYGKEQEEVKLEDRESCIKTLEMLRNLVFNIHGVMDVIDDKNIKKMISWLSSKEGDWKEIFPDDPESFPPVDDDGYSDHILLSFRNASFLCIGQFRKDENGGAFYDGDEEDPLTRIGLFVNAWMPLPEPYREDGEADG